MNDDKSGVLNLAVISELLDLDKRMDKLSEKMFECEGEVIVTHEDCALVIIKVSFCNSIKNLSSSTSHKKTSSVRLCTGICENQRAWIFFAHCLSPLLL